MTTVINTPSSDRGSGAGLIIAAIVVILLLALFFFVGLPYLRNNTAAPSTSDISGSIDVNLPGSGGSAGGAGSGSGSTGQ